MASGGSPVVVDLGSHSLRVGYAGEDRPAFHCPAAVGVVNVDSDVRKSLNVDCVFPLSPFIKRDHVTVKRPIRFEAAEHRVDANLLRKTFQACSSAASEQVLMEPLSEAMILFAEPSLHRKEFRAAVAEVMFEKLNVAGLAMCKNAALTAYGCGRTSGAVLDAGYSASTAAVVQDGYVVQKSVVSSPLAGRHLNMLTEKNLKAQHIEMLPAFAYDYVHTTPPVDPAAVETHSGLNRLHALLPPAADEPKLKPVFLPFVDPEYLAWTKERMVEVVKEAFCRLPAVNKIDDRDPPAPFRLPDGTAIDPAQLSSNLAQSLFKAVPADATDDPPPAEAAPQGSAGLGAKLCESIALSELGMNREISSGILVTGGTSVLPNFLERLRWQLELEGTIDKLCPLGWRLIASPNPSERQNAGWIGGSILGSLGSFPYVAATREEYSEYGGPAILDRKCP